MFADAEKESEPGPSKFRVDTPADVAAAAAELRGAGITASDAKLHPVCAPDYWVTPLTHLTLTPLTTGQRESKDGIAGCTV